MREFADRYKTVLVVGGEGEKCRHVAESYGFTDVITPGDIVKANAATAPFRQLTDQERANSRDLWARCTATGTLADVQIDAVFVFADSRDWACDLQILHDLAVSRGGRLETVSDTKDEGPPIYFSHNDLVWAAQHEHVRFGMGALRETLTMLYARSTGGRELRTHAFGKPQVSTFQFADRLLQQWRAGQRQQRPSSSSASSSTAAVTSADGPLETVYFVGDTPESDVRGTNAMNAQAANDWYSILVETGVYQAGTAPAYAPRKTVPTVLDAVRHGIRREMRRRGVAPQPQSQKELLPLDVHKAASKAVRETPDVMVEHLEV